MGYILRTTAVYGNGKFGIADFKLMEDNPDFSQSFSAQMCAVYMLREFSLDWVHFLALQKGGENAVALHRGLQRYLGVGNATGLGMAPYLINHPCIVDQWMTSRERAVARVFAMPCEASLYAPLQGLLQKAQRHLEQVITINEHQDRLNHLAIADIKQLLSELTTLMASQSNWGSLVEQKNTMSVEAQEILTSCLIELYPPLVDEFASQMNTDETLSIPGGKKIQDLLEVLRSKYRWAIDVDYSLAENNYWFWYRSQDKEEPRLGVRGEEAGEDKELPLDIGRQVNRLYHALLGSSEETSVAEFLLQNPAYRSITRRVWTLGKREMGDIQMNVLRQDALPMHLLRCKLAIFGATKFDPRSDRWVRVTFFQGAPLLDEIHDSQLADTWIFPSMPESDEITQSDNQKSMEDLHYDRLSQRTGGRG